MTDKISSDGIYKFLKEKINIEIVDKTESTNNDLKLQGEKGEEDKVLIALSQTHGKGRLGRTFFSPQGGIYMSILCHPTISPEQNFLLTVSAAVSVSKALDKVFGIETGIKWVNDIYYKNKKVCGILTEGQINAKTGKNDFAVVGIGINVYPPENGFPDDIKDKAGYLCAEEKEGLKNKIIAEVLNNFISYYKNLEKREFYSAYKEKNILKGKVVEVPDKGKATVIDIDDNCALTVEFDSGERKSLTTGEVLIKL